MGHAEILWAEAASLDKLSQELARLLADRDPEDVVSVSHESSTVATTQAGGIWRRGRTAQHRVRYSVIVLLRS